MDRPYIFCHMITSIDGKIVGNFKNLPEYTSAADTFYEIAFGKTRYYQHQGWLSGRVTTDDNFTFYKVPDLPETYEPVPVGDFVADSNAEKYYISVDPSGKLAWDSNTLNYRETTAHVLEVLTEKASNAYKQFLRNLGVSYIIAGSNSLDYEVAMSKLKNLFGIRTLMLGGGAILNWSFIQAGMCDELSIVIASVADGNSDSSSLFSTSEQLINENKVVCFKLINVEVQDNSTVWMRYLVKED
ncbi:RibD family protein [Vibrio quintilis]|uniref:RibD family protein n=1 Tax=Vibrio quintilis TaxID=1117707 RepID=UPI0021C96A75|nr:RibD family protein [Vibrio quintilis]